MKVEIFTVIKNEEHILPFFINHYRNAFSECIINIYDNNSTDKSIEICKANNCNVFDFPDFIPYLKEDVLTDLKNNVWKNSNADWIIVCDVDELLQITENNIQVLPVDVNIISTKGYNMIDLNNENLSLEKLVYGVYAPPYCKKIMFKNKYISDMNYEIGAHKCNPVPMPVYSEHVYTLLHYNKHNFTLETFYKNFEDIKKTLNENQIKIINDALNTLFESNKLLAIKVL